MIHADPDIIINNGPTHGLNEVGVEVGIVSLEPNNDFAMVRRYFSPALTTTSTDLETRTSRVNQTSLPGPAPLTCQR
jgi:hypothetical protein